MACPRCGFALHCLLGSWAGLSEDTQQESVQEGRATRSYCQMQNNHLGLNELARLWFWGILRALLIIPSCYCCCLGFLGFVLFFVCYGILWGGGLFVYIFYGFPHWAGSCFDYSSRLSHPTFWVDVQPFANARLWAGLHSPGFRLPSIHLNGFRL